MSSARRDPGAPAWCTTATAANLCRSSAIAGDRPHLRRRIAHAQVDVLIGFTARCTRRLPPHRHDRRRRGLTAAFEPGTQARRDNPLRGSKPARAAFLARAPRRPRARIIALYRALGAAAGLPLVATDVGGIPEIYGPDASYLVPPGDPIALARAIGPALEHLAVEDGVTRRLQTRIRTEFSADVMTDAVLAAYVEALVSRFRGP